MRRLLALAAMMVAIGSLAAAVPLFDGEGFTRLLHDCSDDWGNDERDSPRTVSGHNLQSLDVREISKDGHDGIQFRLTFNRGWGAGFQPDREPLRLNVTVATSNGTFMTHLRTVDTTDAYALQHDDTDANSTAPFHIGATVMDPDDNFTRGYVNLTYRHGDLDLYRDDQITAVTVTSLDNMTRADRMPGGYYDGLTDVHVPACPQQSSNATRQGFVADAYNLTRGDARPQPYNEPPIVLFSILPTAPKAGETVSFADDSVDPDGTLVAWHWDFGDGSTSSDQNATHAYAAAGTYPVRFNVTDDGGASNETTLSLVVAAAPEGGGNGNGQGGSNGGDPDPDNQPPISAFSVTPAQAYAGEPVTFQDTSSDPDGHIVAWTWSFGDGGASSNRNTTHTYAASGTYAVKLTVKDDDGTLALHTIGIKVAQARVGETNAAPVGRFSWSPILPIRLEEIQFTDASTDSDGDVVSWHWDFGTGASSTKQHPRYTFPDAGDFTVALRVTDNDGASHVIEQQVAVTDPYADQPGVDDPPRADFDFKPTQPLTSDRIKFADLSEDDNGVVAWAWDFGDGGQSSEQSPVHRFVSEGVYTVQLTVRDAAGQSDAVGIAVVVDAPRFDAPATDSDGDDKWLPAPMMGAVVPLAAAAWATRRRQRRGD